MDVPDAVLATSMGDLSVTPAESDDAAGVVRLRDDLAAWMIERGIDQWRPGDIPPRWIESQIAQGRIHVVRIEGRLAASVWLGWEDLLVWGPSTDPAGYVHMLMVERAHAGRGIGRSLLKWAERNIHRSGRTRVRLDCVKGNDRLREYYRRADYREVGTKAFPDLEGVPACVLFEKRLER